MSDEEHSDVESEGEEERGGEESEEEEENGETSEKKEEEKVEVVEEPPKPKPKPPIPDNKVQIGFRIRPFLKDEQKEDFSVFFYHSELIEKKKEEKKETENEEEGEDEDEEEKKEKEEKKEEEEEEEEPKFTKSKLEFIHPITKKVTEIENVEHLHWSSTPELNMSKEEYLMQQEEEKKKEKKDDEGEEDDEDDEEEGENEEKEKKKKFVFCEHASDEICNADVMDRLVLKVLKKQANAVTVVYGNKAAGKLYNFKNFAAHSIEEIFKDRTPKEEEKEEVEKKEEEKLEMKEEKEEDDEVIIQETPEKKEEEKKEETIEKVELSEVKLFELTKSGALDLFTKKKGLICKTEESSLIIEGIKAKVITNAKDGKEMILEGLEKNISSSKNPLIMEIKVNGFVLLLIKLEHSNTTKNGNELLTVLKAIKTIRYNEDLQKEKERREEIARLEELKRLEEEAERKRKEELERKKRKSKKGKRKKKKVETESESESEEEADQEKEDEDDEEKEKKEKKKQEEWPEELPGNMQFDCQKGIITYLYQELFSNPSNFFTVYSVLDPTSSDSIIKALDYSYQIKYKLS